ncbi:hypothetical protein GCM10007939_09250 [Amylibacter marinus]|uniref:DNA repair protein MmcB-related protein n=1 Tax=Amylibacter marinus TaxID=1475483 RepID=A0ABQ5VTR6_9RHOB|nr:MmcB family DNA repair protein [Amylibacter marinus]GLQ34642.1 hypothetical protein GCM10007939_09250 [Amylibacter marinus]
MAVDGKKLGKLLARGVTRHLAQLNYRTLTEFTLSTGRRVDVIGLGPRGEVWIVECKSSKADFQSDSKWMDYLEWCDRFFWATPLGFPLDILPKNMGIICADPYGAEIVAPAAETKLSAPRRRSLTLQFARNSAQRLHALTDPKIDT